MSGAASLFPVTMAAVAALAHLAVCWMRRRATNPFGTSQVWLDEQPARFWLVALAGSALYVFVILAVAGEDPLLRTIALIAVTAGLLAHLAVSFVRALRTGRIAGTARAEHPEAYWSGMAGFLMIIALVVVAAVITFSA